MTIAFYFWNLACVLFCLIDLLAAEYEGKLTCATFPALQFPLNPAASLLGNPARVKFSFDTVLASHIRYKCLQKKKNPSRQQRSCIHTPERIDKKDERETFVTVLTGNSKCISLFPKSCRNSKPP